MSDRERWIVYPLLFLALGVSLRDKIIRTIDGVSLLTGKSVVMDLDSGFFEAKVVQADLIRCERLEVQEGLDKPLVILGGVKVPTQDGTVETSGVISLYGEDGQEIMVLQAGQVLTSEPVEGQNEDGDVEVQEESAPEPSSQSELPKSEDEAGENP